MVIGTPHGLSRKSEATDAGKEVEVGHLCAFFPFLAFLAGLTGFWLVIRSCQSFR